MSADVTNVARPSESRLWPVRVIWAVSCGGAMLGWISALATASWKMLGWLTSFE